MASSILGREAWLVHAFSTRKASRGGNAPDFDLEEVPPPRGTGKVEREITPNHRRFVAALEAASQLPPGVLRLVTARQVHGSAIWHDPDIGAAGDGLVTRRPHRLLAVRTADCVPILLADPERRVVAAVHAGWRGTHLRIAVKAVGEMRVRYGSHPGHILAALGPSIRRCCYRVGEDVRQSFLARFPDAEDWFTPSEPGADRLQYPLSFLQGAAPGHDPDPRWNRDKGYGLDLAEVNCRQLLEAGLTESHIEVLPGCTACMPKRFFSHRRDSKCAGRMMAAIAIR